MKSLKEEGAVYLNRAAKGLELERFLTIFFLAADFLRRVAAAADLYMVPPGEEIMGRPLSMRLAGASCLALRTTGVLKILRKRAPSLGVRTVPLLDRGLRITGVLKILRNIAP